MDKRSTERILLVFIKTVPKYKNSFNCKHLLKIYLNESVIVKIFVSRTDWARLIIGRKHDRIADLIKFIGIHHK